MPPSPFNPQNIHPHNPTFIFSFCHSTKYSYFCILNCDDTVATQITDASQKPLACYSTVPVPMYADGEQLPGVMVMP